MLLPEKSKSNHRLASSIFGDALPCLERETKTERGNTMAYMSQQTKKDLTPNIKLVLKKYNMKGSISVKNHSTIVVNLKSGPIDIISDANRLRKKYSERHDRPFYEIDKGYFQVNPFHIDKDHSGQSAKFLNELVNAMKGADYFCEDQIETDYFHRSHFTDINVGGGWKNPYQLAA